MIKGISQMFSKEGTPKGYAFYSKNIIINRKLDEIINEKGHEIISAFITSSVTDIVGLIAHGSKVIIFYNGPASLTPPYTKEGRIGVYDENTGSFTLKLARSDFNFSSDFPITGEAKLNSKGQLIVVFSDNNTTPKYINLDTATSADNLGLYNLSLVASDPSISFEVIEGGGSMKTGVHFLSIQYEDINKNVSNYSDLSKPIYITNHNDLGNFGTTQGSAAGVVSNKGIKFTISNADTSFKKLRAILITKIEDVVTVASYKTVEITGSTTTFTITGTELASTLTIEEVLTFNQVFQRVRHFETLGDQLFAADYSTPEVIDFQNIANRIRLEWTSSPKYDAVVDQGANQPVRKSGNNQKTFFHDEVYAMYAQFELTDNTHTEWFHIPGRALTASHRANSSINNDIKFNGNTPKVFQLQSTAELGGIIGSLNDIVGETYAYGNFGVWENEDELYPSNFPDFAGQRVRHHRFPSLEWLRDNVYGGSTANSFMVDMWDMLGIKYSFNLTDLDTTLLSQIKSIRIGYAKRDISNTSVLGYDIAQLGAHPEISAGVAIDTNLFDPTIIGSAGGNWRVYTTANSADLNASNSFVRLHSPDVMKLKPSVENMYLANQLKLKITDLNVSFFTSDSVKPRGYILRGGTEIVDGASAEIDIFTYVSNFIAADELGTYSSLFKYIPLQNPKYIPANSIVSVPDGTVNNLLSEECIHAKLPPGVNLLLDVSGTGGSTNAFKVQQGIETASPGLFEETALVAIKVPRTNFFTSYADQIVVPITQKLDPDSFTGILWGEGDAFICTHSFVTMASAPLADHIAFNATEDDGIRCVKVFLCESRLNLNQRYITQENYNTYFYPAGVFGQQTNKSNYWFTKLNQLNAPVNEIQLSKSFNAINDLEQNGVYDHTKIYESELPYAIARSLIASRSTDFEDGWRQFRPNDVFYTVRNKGGVTNLVAWGSDKLLIHHERALFITRDKAVLQTDITKISLGSGDLFAIEPQELIPTDYGYGGTQHKFGCLLCEAGYAFVDKSAGEILLYKEGNSYVNIGKGLTNVFQELLTENTIGDNPYKSSASSITLGFDKRYKRILLSLKADSVNLTASFDLIKEEWKGFNDYIPEGMIHTRENLYSFKNHTFYRHNTGRYGQFYGTIYPSFVDLIINEEPEVEKILSAIEWITRVEKNGAVMEKETITHVTIWNDHFCTGKISINQLTDLIDYENKNTKSADRTWRFNEILSTVRDINSPFVGGLSTDYRPISNNFDNTLAWFEKEEIRGKYFIVRLEYSNSEDKLVSLRSLIPNIKRSSC